MSKTSDLIGLGLAPELSAVVGQHVSVATALTAAGSAIGDALALSKGYNLVATTASSTGVKLPNVPIGEIVYVRNDGANSLSVYPHDANGTIAAGGAGAAQAIATTKKGRFIRLTTTNWDYTLEN